MKLYSLYEIDAICSTSLQKSFQKISNFYKLNLSKQNSRLILPLKELESRIFFIHSTCKKLNAFYLISNKHQIKQTTIYSSNPRKQCLSSPIPTIILPVSPTKAPTSIRCPHSTANRKVTVVHAAINPTQHARS